MEVSLIELDLTQIDSSGRPMGEGRSEGTHLMQVVNHAKARAGEAPQDTGNQNFLSMGFLFEVLLERAFKTFGALMRKDREKIKRPPEMQLDGIYCSPDGLDVDTLEEYKLTYKSLRRLTGTNPAKGDCGGDLGRWLKQHHWWWLVQIMAYCWVVGVTKARLIALFVNGDYSFQQPLGGPQLIVVELGFIEEELSQNWQNILAWRDEMEADKA